MAIGSFLKIGSRLKPAARTPHRHHQGGYTLIELMIVVSIIGILASIAQPSFQQYRIRAKETNLKRTLFIFRDVIDQYYADHGKYPEDLAELVSGNYIRSMPADPFTRSSDSWIVSPPPEGEKGAVFDVHSGSDLVGLDGVPYNDW